MSVVVDSVREAIEDTRDGATWLRPLSWQGTGSALVQERGGLWIVPDPRGGHRWTPRPDDLVGAWEVVSPDGVIAERAALYERTEAR